MRVLYIIIINLFFLGQTTAQDIDNCYQKYLQKGNETLEEDRLHSEQIGQALKFFRLAAACALSKREKLEINERVSKTKILYTSALKAERIKAIYLKDRLVGLGRKNQELIDAFYFYEDKFAVAYKGDQYGYINKKGEVVIDYRYEEAENFEDGFAKVKKYGKKYWIDTLGKEYRLAESLKELSREVLALDLSGQDFDTFPLEILNHPQLKILKLSNSRIPLIPNEISKLKKLEVLYFKYNTELKGWDGEDSSMLSLPENIGALQQLKELNFIGNNLDSLPESIGQLLNLEVLRLRSNNLKTLPKSIGLLDKLKILDLADNNFRELPNDIFQLQKLEILDLSNNKLESLDRIGQLQKLEVLGLNFNWFMSLPESIVQLPRLRVLEIRSNNIVNLSESIGQLHNLEILSLSHNYIEHLPESIGQLSKLEYLSLQSNKLSSLPVGVYRLKKLQEVELKGVNLTDEVKKNLKDQMPWCKFIWD
jgi:Leucine-rich repeat (LRR) protein